MSNLKEPRRRGSFRYIGVLLGLLLWLLRNMRLKQLHLRLRKVLAELSLQLTLAFLTTTDKVHRTHTHCHQ